MFVIINTNNMTDNIDKIKDSLERISRNFSIEKKIYDLHLGKINKVTDEKILINKVVFHIPYLYEEKLFVLWKCLWPDCHNCCENQGRLPLTKNDISRLSNGLGYKSKIDFINTETKISSWKEGESGSNIIGNITMLSLKRKKDEKDEEDGKPIRCRFLDLNGNCSVQDFKPGVCILYPFSSWIQIDEGKPKIHASFQFTGDCPGFYTSDSLNPMTEILENYSQKIFNYNMEINLTLRENYASISLIEN